MLNKLKRKMQPKLLLSQAPDIIALVPGTNTPDISDATKAKYGQTCQRLITYFGDIPVESITREGYAGFHDWLAGRETTNEITVNGYRRQARALWHRLAERGYQVCDIEGITKELPPPLQRSKAVTDEHLQRVMQIASVRDAAIVLYMVRSGIRRQTVPRLTIAGTKIWQRPDGLYRIASQIPQEKTSAPRLIMAEHDAALAVHFWLAIRKHQDSPWLFPAYDTGGQLDKISVGTIFARLRQRAGIPTWASFGAHSLRHKFAQTMLDDHDAKTVSQWMGISTETLLQVYAYRSAEDLVTRRFGDSDYPADLLPR